MAISLIASKRGLEIVDRARRKKGWNKQETAWYQLAEVSLKTLKRFWGRVIPIKQDNFIKLCEFVGVKNWEEVVDWNSLHLQNYQLYCFAYNDGWVGREKLVKDLTKKLQNSCRLLILVGMTGIGKTALGEKLVIDLQDWLGDWSKFIRDDFDNEQKTHDFASVAARLLEKCQQTITPEEKKDTQTLLYRLVKHLQENYYLVQIDSVEHILQGNEEEGWTDFIDEWWVKFFQTWLKLDYCQSRIIITSQDLPSQIDLGGKRKDFWYCQPLSGLKAKEQLDLFEKKGLSTESEHKTYLQRIGSAYEGHPLALEVIAGEIKNTPFNTNVIAYWKKYGHEIEEVEKALEEAKSKGIISAKDTWNLHLYTRNLRKQVKVRLEKTFTRLEKEVRDAYILLCEASIYRCPVTEDFWLSHLEDWDMDEERQNKALEALHDRYLIEALIEDNEEKIRQHNLIRSISLKKIEVLDENE